MDFIKDVRPLGCEILDLRDEIKIFQNREFIINFLQTFQGLVFLEDSCTK